ncbi:tyrosine-type recombinase/integrase [Clostridiaceae bacterium UIB06]|uniref:Tyrosine-type recombinase/integrase n=1 Tax=Clostridium thailandense TaxID=2794346 RepID=A0A949WXK3_9CLOT|nr:tyrosine-type recombinase/integrase [Clostridium thailandense]MBV7276052.1 tyrosine-type recombinase/integrase [Clostridium thailandense]MCH5135843.1 tyrosine-type recombinase/integrase [Clostridiaceae bacterium UIB06]
MQHNLWESCTLNGFKEYLIKGGKAVNTIKSYMLHLENYFKWYKNSFGEEIQKLYRQNVLEYKSYLQNIDKGVKSAKTINAKLSALIKFNEYLQEQGIQDDVVVSKKDNIKIQTEVASPAVVTKNDVEAFRQQILKYEGNRNYAIVTIMAYAGLRISECLDLKLDDIDLTAKEIVVKCGKGNKQRIVYINSKIIDAVKEYLQERKCKQIDLDYLFISNKNNKIDRTVINRLFNKYSNKITPHTLRHFYCSNALEAGYSVHEVANQAGHSNIHTTLLYTNPTKEKMKSKAELL